MSDFNDVGDFHRKFGLDSVTYRGPGPREVPDELMNFRIEFLEEEFQEFKDAWAAKDYPQMFDALLDLVYVAYGTAHLQGFPWVEGWAKVHSANMSKVRAQKDGSDSVRGSLWDVVKPPGWIAPDIDNLLRMFGWLVGPRCPICKRDMNDLEVSCVVNFDIVLETYDGYCDLKNEEFHS